MDQKSASSSTSSLPSSPGRRQRGQRGQGQVIHVNPNFQKKRALTPPAPAVAAANVHLNPKFSQAAHVNPNFKQTSASAGTSATVHVNPKFANRPLPAPPTKTSETGTAAAAASNNTANSSFALDPGKKDGYHEAVAKTVVLKVFVNPKFSQPSSSTSTSKTVYVDPSLIKAKKRQQLAMQQQQKQAVEKENDPSSSSSLPAARPRKSVFKKIGNKKLVRVRKDSASSPSGSGSPHFKKIGTKKLVRLKSSAGGSKASPASRRSPGGNLSWRSRLYHRTPSSPRKGGAALFSRLVTPLSLKRRRTRTRPSPPQVRTPRAKAAVVGRRNKRKNNIYSLFNPFKIDRRRQRQPRTEEAKTPSSTTTAVEPKTPRSAAPPKPARTSLMQTPAKGATTPATAAVAVPTVVNIQGVKYKISANGMALNRIQEKKAEDRKVAASSPAAAPPAESAATDAPSMARTRNRASLLDRKLFLDGDEWVEDEDQPGVLVRSRHSMTRASITSARNRSIHTIQARQARSKQYCMFFNKFGRCNKRDKGVCPYIHDADKVAVCRRFLQGSCHKSDCLLSHRVAPEKMPTCKFFLGSGLCEREACPYRHVKVNPEAEVCPEYLKGFCSAGVECRLRHVSRCPQFEKAGVCARGDRCPYPHVSKKARQAAAAETSETPRKTPRRLKTPPPKPKRKSVGGSAAAATVDKKKARMRYFDGPPSSSSAAADKQEAETPKAVPSSSAGNLEAKRKRLLKKVELAKQGWTATVDKEESAADMDDSGPYEEIEEEEEDGARAPLGDLPSFIPLGGGDEDEEEEEREVDERLI